MLAGADGDDRPAIDAAIDALDPATAERVVMTGRVDEAARSWLLRHAAVLAYPSLDEGFGFPLLDAMQVGVPIVASNRGSIPEVAGGAGCSCDADDADGARRQPGSARSSTTTSAARLVAAGSGTAGARSRGSDCAADLAALYRRLADESPADDRRAVRRRRRRPVPARRWRRSSSRPTRSASSTPATTPCCTAWSISPDLDTVTYTLADAIDPERGWGLADESWRAMEALAALRRRAPDGSSAAPTWFNLGDRDLATHFYRTARLAEGATLTEVTAEICAAWGVAQRLRADERPDGRRRS